MDEGTGNQAPAPLWAKNNSAAESELIVDIIVWVSKSLDQVALIKSEAKGGESVALGRVRHISKIPDEWFYLLCQAEPVPFLLLRDEFNSFKSPGMSMSHTRPAIQGELLKVLVRNIFLLLSWSFYLALDAMEAISVWKWSCWKHKQVKIKLRAFNEAHMKQEFDKWMKHGTCKVISMARCIHRIRPVFLLIAVLRDSLRLQYITYFVCRMCLLLPEESCCFLFFKVSWTHYVLKSLFTVAFNKNFGKIPLRYWNQCSIKMLIVLQPIRNPSDFVHTYFFWFWKAIVPVYF